MAHFLSDVTHERLQLRVEDENYHHEPHNIPGLIHTHDFYSSLRCISVVERTVSDEIKGKKALIRCWTGDLNGDISVRSGLVGEPIYVIRQALDNVYVYALQQYGSSMWAGLSNGLLLVYDMNSYKRINETKAHSAAINCFLCNGDFIFSASSDWQIAQWNAKTMQKIPGSQFACQNSVRCLALDGTLLYAGSDDCIIRCWDLTTNTELTGTWPVVAHHDSVRAIAIKDMYLFSSSTDGTVNVWNTQTAELVQQLEVCNACITALCIDKASNFLWTGSSDGLINVWNIETLTHVGTIDDHANTNVASIQQVARLNAVQLWTVCADGKIRSWYMEGDPNIDEYNSMVTQQVVLQKIVAEYRNRILSNYEELERCKAELLLLEERDTRKKQNLAKVLGEYSCRFLQKKYLYQSMISFDKVKIKEWKLVPVAAYIERRNQIELLQRYWGNLLLATKLKMIFRRKEKVAVYMASYNNDCITRNYLHRLEEVVGKEHVRHFKGKIAQLLANAHIALFCQRYWNDWRRRTQCTVLVNQGTKLSTTLGHLEEVNIMAAYWAKIQFQNLRIQSKINEENGIMKIERLKIFHLLSRYYFKWITWVWRKKHHHQIAKAAEIADKHSHYTWLRYWYSQWLHWKDELELADARKVFLAQTDEVKKLQDFIDANEGDNHDLDKVLYSKQYELASLQNSSKDLDNEIRALEKRNAYLQRELLVGANFDCGAENLEQVRQALYLLKARALNCFAHEELLKKKRDEIKRFGAQIVYIDSLENIKTIFKKLIKPRYLMHEDGSPEWYIGNAFSRMTKKTINTANEFIVTVCHAFDTMNKANINAWVTQDSKGNETWAPEHSHNSEITTNLPILLDIAIRDYRFRNKLNPETGLPPVKKGKVGGAAGKKKKIKVSKTGGKKKALKAPGGKKNKKAGGEKKKKEKAVGEKGKKKVAKVPKKKADKKDVKKKLKKVKK